MAVNGFASSVSKVNLKAAVALLALPVFGPVVTSKVHVPEGLVVSERVAFQTFASTMAAAAAATRNLYILALI